MTAELIGRMYETLTNSILGILVFWLFWLAAYPKQQFARLRPDVASIPAALTWISGFPRTATVEPGSVGLE